MRYANGDKLRRVEWVDTCRGIGILLVVLGHCNPPWSKYIYSFHMPLFFILSGYLFRQKKNVLGYSKKIMRRYIFPYFILCFINLIIVTITEGGNNFRKYILGIVYSRGSAAWMPNCSPLWFLTCIAVALSIYNLIIHIRNAKVQIILIGLAAAVSYFLNINNAPKLPWNIDTALMATPFIAVGHLIYLKQDELDEIDIPYFKWITVLLGCLATYFNLTTVSFNNNDYGNIALMFIAGILIPIGIMEFVKQYNPFPKVFGFYGTYTMFIMGFDYFCGAIVQRFTSNYVLLFVGKTLILTFGIILWKGIKKLMSNFK